MVLFRLENMFMHLIIGGIQDGSKQWSPASLLITLDNGKVVHYHVDHITQAY